MSTDGAGRRPRGAHAEVASKPSGSEAIEVFTRPRAMVDTFVALTDQALVVAHPGPEELARCEQDLRGSGVASSDARVIPFEYIDKVKANRHRSDINVWFTDGAEKRAQNIAFSAPATRDRALRSLHRRLGRAFRVQEVEFGFVRAVAWPVAWIVGLSALTKLAAVAAAELDEGASVVIRGRHRMTKRLFATVLDILGPTGVWIVGTLLTLVAVWWLVARVRQPPRMITLSRR